MGIVKQHSLEDNICDLHSRKIKIVFFKQTNKFIDWRPISKEVDKHYIRGRKSVYHPNYNGLLISKMSLFQTWYGLSDYEVENQVNDCISLGYFCDLTTAQNSAYHSTLGRFRTVLTKGGVYEHLFHSINAQLEAHKIVVTKGLIVDASVIDTPLLGKVKHAVNEDIESEGKTEYTSSVYNDWAWIKKQRKLYFRYKRNHLIYQEGLGVLTIPTNRNEVSNLEEALNKATYLEWIPLKSGEGYQF